MLNLKDLLNKVKKLSRKQVIILLLVLAVLSVIFYQQLVSKVGTVDGTEISDVKQVEIMSVRDLSLDQDALPLLGEVQSQSSATIYSQTAGEVIGVYKKLGDFVYAEQIIAEINNWSQKSAVAQAKAGVEVAQATLDKIKKGGRDEQLSILKTTLDNSQKTLAETKLSVVNVLNDTFIKVDDSIRNKIDIMFTDARRDNPQVLFSVNSAQLEIDIEWGRFVIEEMLKDWDTELSNLNTTDGLIAKLNQASEDVDSVRVFLNNLALAVNVLAPNANLSETTINTWKANISLVRTTINLAISTLSATKSGLNNTESALEIAQLNYDQAEAGGRSEDVIIAEAQLRQAEAGLQSAYANLEKTIIRAPISGTINSLELERGDFVSAFTPVVTIANNETLKIIAYITEDDRTEIAVGSEVLIGPKGKGVVKSIAPTLDSQTKKIKVEISVEDSETSLTNGQSVSLSLKRVSSEDGILTEFSAPISAIKIGVEQAVVYTVNEENRLTAHPVILGPILGGKIVVLEGLTAEMEIVIDARGLQEGEEVHIK